jgi:hypothetical protein
MLDFTLCNENKIETNISVKEVPIHARNFLSIQKIFDTYGDCSCEISFNDHLFSIT